MNISEIMSIFPAAVEARGAAHEALDTARLLGVHQLLVVEQGELVGVVCCCELEAARSEDTVLSRTKTPAVALSPNEPVERAVRIVESSGIGCLPVLAADGTLAGILTRRDLRAAGMLEDGPGSCACCGRRQELRPARCPDALVLCTTCEQRDYLHKRRSELPDSIVAESA